MRHGKKVNHLGRQAGHRRALLSNMANSLIREKRITTTVAKAKALRKYVEPLITRAKTDTTHSRRMAFSYLLDKAAVSTLFGEVASRTSERPGGYTRIIRLSETRVGDNAEMCLIELVDFNEIYKPKEEDKSSKTRRSRRKGKKEETEPAEEVKASAEAPQTSETEEKANPADTETAGEQKDEK